MVVVLVLPCKYNAIFRKSQIIPLFLAKTWSIQKNIVTLQRIKGIIRIMVLTKVIDKDGNVLAERERPHVSRARMSSARMIRKNGTVKKPRTVVMSTEEFLKSVSQSVNGMEGAAFLGKLVSSPLTDFQCLNTFLKRW